MWRLFQRSAATQTHPTTPPPSAPASLHHAIANIEMMDDAAVVTITSDELSNVQGLESMSDLVDHLARTEARHYILDLQNVSHIDSACAGKLVEVMNSLSTRGGRLALVNPGHSVESVFKLTRLDRIFPICRDVMSGLRAVHRA